MNTVVYYPHFYPSPDWLKIAALCWDKVYTMGSVYAKYRGKIIEVDRGLGGVLEHKYIDSWIDQSKEETQGFLTGFSLGKKC